MRSVFYPRLVNGSFGDPALYVRLAHRGDALLFDCGDLHPLTPRDALKISAVFVSHAHIDHMVGFDALIRLFLCRDHRLLVFGPTGIIAQVAGRLAGYTWNLTEGYPFVLVVREWSEEGGKEAIFRAQNAFRREDERPWAPGRHLLETSSYRVHAYSLDHGGITSLAFTLEEPLHIAIHKDALERHGYRPGRWLTGFKDRLRRGDAADAPIEVPLADGGVNFIPLAELSRRIAHIERGMKVSYVTDASPTPENMEKIVALAVDSHLLVIEAPFAHHELSRAQERNHLTAGLAGHLAWKAGVARVLVFHHSPRYQDRPELLRAEAERAFAGEEIDHGSPAT